MKKLWQNGKMTSFGKRITALALALCFLASFAQNIAFKPISATEAVSGSDVTVATESDVADVSGADTTATASNIIENYAASLLSAENTKTINLIYTGTNENVTVYVSGMQTDTWYDTYGPAADNGFTVEKSTDSNGYIQFAVSFDFDSIYKFNLQITDGSAFWAENIWFSYEDISAGTNLTKYVYEDGTNGTTAPDADTTAVSYAVNVYVYGQDAEVGGWLIYSENGTESAWSANTTASGILNDDWATATLTYTYANGSVYNGVGVQLIENDTWLEPIYKLSFDGTICNMWIVPEAGECYDNEADALAAVTEDTTPDYSEPQITMTTSLAIGSTMNLSITADDTVYIDWGDGNIVEYASDGVTAGTDIKIYCNGNITELTSGVSNLTDLDVSNSRALTYLDCFGNSLSELDVSSNTALIYLNCACNSLSELDVSNNTALTHIECYDNSMNGLDFSKNSALTYLNCYGCNLSNLNLIGCINLEEIDCGWGKLTQLDLSTNIGLKKLACDYNTLKSLDLFVNSEIEEVHCIENQLTELNVKNCGKLKTIYCEGNLLTTIDLSTNSALEFLWCYGNSLTELDVSNNVVLNYLRFEANEISEIDLSSNTELTALRCSENRISELDLSNNTKLCGLSCNGNYLTELDLSNNTELTDINCADNQLTELDLSNNTKLCGIIDLSNNNLTSLKTNIEGSVFDTWVNGNRLKFSDMLDLNTSLMEYAGFVYSPQGDIPIAGSAVAITGVVDLSSEYDIDGTYTIYTWYNASDDSVVTPTTSENGVFTFGEEFVGETLYCTMTNDVFPDLTLTTTAVEITEAPLDLGEPKITMTTQIPIGETMNLTIVAGGKMYIDWGDGNCIYTEEGDEGVVAGTVKGSEIKIYCDGNIQMFGCSDCSIIGIDVSNCTELESLSCDSNYLTEIDVSKNIELVSLNCDNNQIASIDISNNINLRNIGCWMNELTELDVSNNTALTSVQCENNLIEELDLSNNPELDLVNVGYNQLTELDLSNNPNITYLYCEDNNLTELDVSGCTKIELLSCYFNELTELDVSGNAMLYELHCDSNALKFSTLKMNLVDGVNYNYSPQAKVEIPSQAYEIDLSSEYDINGTKTVYTWYNAADDSVVTPTTAENGIFTFGEEFVGESLYCTMTNDVFPDLTLTTTTVEITEAIPDLGEPQITMITELEIGSEICIDVWADDTVYIDLGDGNIEKYPYYNINEEDNVEGSHDGLLAGSEIKIYCEGSITILYLGAGGDSSQIPEYHNGITYIDVKKAVDLESLCCASNPISELDLSGNTKLESLNCNCTEISKLDLSQNTNLRYLHCEGNNIESLDISNNKELITLNFSKTHISEINLSNNEKLKSVNLCYTPMSSIDISNNKLIEIFVCNHCNFRFSTLPQNVVNFNAGGFYIDPYTSFYTPYVPQNDISIAEEINVEKAFADLSSEYDINGTKTVYTWYNASDDSVVTPTTAENGVFTFGEEFVGETLYCTMTNDVFPDLTLTTTVVEIIEAPAEDEEEPEVSDGDLTVEDDNDYVGDVEVEEGTTFEDEDGNKVAIGNLHLIIGNVENDKQKHVVEAVKRYNEAFDTEGNNYALYEIHLETDNGVKVTEIDGRIQICIKYPKNLGAECTDYTYNLYHLKDDGTVEEVQITCKPNGIWFYADEFSPFVLVWNLKTQIDSEVQGDSDSSNPKTGDDSNNVTAAIVLASSFALMAAYAVSGVVIYKKRRKAEK